MPNLSGIWVRIWAAQQALAVAVQLAGGGLPDMVWVIDAAAKLEAFASGLPPELLLVSEVA